MKTKRCLIQIRPLRMALLPAAIVALLAQSVTAQQWTTNTLPSGLLGWWQADNNYVDTVGGNNLTADGGVSFGSGHVGEAFQFDGISGSAYCTGAPALNNWTQFTLEAWINLDNVNDNAGGGQGIIDRLGNNDSNHGYELGIYGNGTGMFCQFNSDAQSWPANQTSGLFPQPLVAGVWYHVAATYDHNATVLYFNGLPFATNVVGPVTLANSTSAFRISKDDNNNLPFSGRIDDVRIYNRALSAAEIAYLYEGPPPGTNQIVGQLLGNGDMRFSYGGILGTNYAVDRTFNLAPAVWVPLATNPAGIGGLLLFTNTPDTTTNNFWRVRSVP